jgi:hypothetical protein
MNVSGNEDAAHHVVAGIRGIDVWTAGAEAFALGGRRLGGIELVGDQRAVARAEKGSHEPRGEGDRADPARINR